LRTPYAILSSNGVYSDGARVAPKCVMERRTNLAAPVPPVGGFFREERGPAVDEAARPRLAGIGGAEYGAGSNWRASAF
jgi:hypothetical protein